MYTSLGFLVLMIRLPVWSTYLEIINGSTLVREFVLKNDVRRMNGAPRQRMATADEKKMRDLQMLLGAGYGATMSMRYADAKQSYLRIIDRVQPSPERRLLPGSMSVVAGAQNNLAWLLATCPDTSLRDAGQAVEHALRAVDLEPNQGNYWNTLGVAYYRNGQWDEARKALGRSMEMRENGDAFDWFFLALVEAKQGRKAEAQDWFAKAVNWYHRARPGDQELRRFHVEAAQELGVSAPSEAPMGRASRITTRDRESSITDRRSGRAQEPV